MKQIRTLTADEIECRIQSIKEGRGKTAGSFFAVLLLYKDTRCDMNILDETYTPLGWQRDHKEVNDNLFGGVGIWDAEKGWIWKWDAGSESNTEAEKGHASDSFKRACFNLGIGRELYTSPFIYLKLNEDEYYTDSQGKPKSTASAKFNVCYVTYDDNRRISGLLIRDGKGAERFKFGIQPKAAAPDYSKGFQTLPKE